ncbi:MAG: hypothetical protein ACSLEY_02105 [Candidatus Saccharimonadales bacterium]
MGVHQRIDKIARRSLTPFMESKERFPGIRAILHFEGKNGPDGIKRKSPGKDEPWHYMNPENPTDLALLVMIDDHIHNLAIALRKKNEERAAFEAAWLAHAITDGLTPAHHYPLEEKLVELRGGQGLETRNTKRAKIILPGTTKRHQLQNNWEYWGAGGVMTSHLGFELGIMTALGSHRLDRVVVREDIKTIVDNKGYRAGYLTAVKQVNDMALFDEYAEKGWTRHLARQSREILIPTIVEAVTLAWHTALEKSREAT